MKYLSTYEGKKVPTTRKQYTLPLHSYGLDYVIRCEYHGVENAVWNYHIEKAYDSDTEWHYESELPKDDVVRIIDDLQAHYPEYFEGSEMGFFAKTN